MLKMAPLISIITVNFNDKIGLERTLESVFSQNFRNFEYLVIDGGSNDGSKDLLEKNSEKINYWVSEPDKGIYNAMNKGISFAKGEYLIFLNSGDHLKNENSLEIAQKSIDLFKARNIDVEDFSQGKNGIGGFFTKILDFYHKKRPGFPFPTNEESALF